MLKLYNRCKYDMPSTFNDDIEKYTNQRATVLHFSVQQVTQQDKINKVGLRFVSKVVTY